MQQYARICLLSETDEDNKEGIKLLFIVLSDRHFATRHKLNPCGFVQLKHLKMCTVFQQIVLYISK